MQPLGQTSLDPPLTTSATFHLLCWFLSIPSPFSGGVPRVQSRELLSIYTYSTGELARSAGFENHLSVEVSPFLSQAQTSAGNSTFLYPTAVLTSPLGCFMISKITSNSAKPKLKFISHMSLECPSSAHLSKGELCPCCSGYKAERHPLWVSFLYMSSITHLEMGCTFLRAYRKCIFRGNLNILCPLYSILHQTRARTTLLKWIPVKSYLCSKPSNLVSSHNKILSPYQQDSLHALAPLLLLTFPLSTVHLPSLGLSHPGPLSDPQSC